MRKILKSLRGEREREKDEESTEWVVVMDELNYNSGILIKQKGGSMKGGRLKEDGCVWMEGILKGCG